MDKNISFGRWLSARRHLLDLTQDELARRVGCSVVTIRKLEADERRPSKQVAERLATSLGIAEAEHAAFLTFARSETLGDAADLPLPSATPPPSLPSAFPTPLTALIGREQDLAAIRNELLRHNTRLLTLVGSPGIGKTSLALAVAHQIQAAFIEGVVFVALAPVSDPDLVIDTIAQTLGVKEIGDQPLLAVLQTHLRDRRQLLVLDNFEQVLGAASGIAELLTSCPRLKVLVTSRAALRIRGEQLYHVPPLLLPDLAQLPPMSALAQIPTVALFIERAQAVQPSFRLTAANAAAVAEICTCLDGLPLAIELAAARVKLFSPEALLKRLDRRLAVLVGGPRDVHTRQQTLRNTIAWSYHLLPTDEQALFRRMGVFSGGCTLEAIEAVCKTHNDRTLDIVEGVTELIDQSLVWQREKSDGELRFGMYETIREYALEQLEVADEAQLIERQHRHFFVGFAEQAASELMSTRQVPWLLRMVEERDNLRAVLTWCQGALESSEGRDGVAGEMGLRLIAALVLFWVYHGDVTEGRKRAEEILKQSQRQNHTPARTKILAHAGAFAWMQGDFVAARSRLAESIAMSRAEGDNQVLAFALSLLGRLDWLEGDNALARSRLEESVALFQGLKLQDTWGLALALGMLGETLLTDGEVANARHLFEQCLALSQSIHDNWNLAWALVSLGRVAWYEGDSGTAGSLADEGIALLRTLGNNWGLAHGLAFLGTVKHAQGDEMRARTSFVESLELFRQMNDQRGICLCLLGFANLAVAQRRLARAIHLYSAVEVLADTVKFKMDDVSRSVYERNVAASRAELADVFTAAWITGRAMTLEQAITYALSDDTLL
jgi:predicted ATPase/DNA-binding XRE family transcriptional regulator